METWNCHIYVYNECSLFNKTLPIKFIIVVNVNKCVSVCLKMYITLFRGSGQVQFSFLRIGS